MKCPECQEEYVIKERYVAKPCPCDEDNRILTFEKVYEDLFKIPVQEILQCQKPSK